jgi:DedD protein
MDRRVKERLVGASILVVLIVLVAPELLSGPPGPAPAALGPRLPVSTPAEPVRNVTVDLATSKAPEPDPAAAEVAASSAQPPEAPSADAPNAGAGAAAPPADASPVVPRSADVSPVVSPRAEAPAADTLRAETPAADTPRAEVPPRTASGSLETTAPAPTSTSAAKAAVAAKPARTGRAWAVQLGSFASHANADKLVRQLKAQGFSVYIVPGGSGPSLRYRVRIGPMADRGAATQALAKLKSTGHAASLVAPAP